MTEKEFYSILLVTDKFQWQITGTREVIRAKLVDHNVKEDGAIIEWWTPITAVCYAYTGQAFHPADDKMAAEVLGLASVFAQKIIHESDFPNSEGGAYNEIV